MTVVVGGGRPLCWFCSSIGHFSGNCPRGPAVAATAATTAAAAAPSPVIAAVVPAGASGSRQGAPGEGGIPLPQKQKPPLSSQRGVDAGRQKRGREGGSP